MNLHKLYSTCPGSLDLQVLDPQGMMRHEKNFASSHHRSISCRSQCYLTGCRGLYASLTEQCSSAWQTALQRRPPIFGLTHKKEEVDLLEQVGTKPGGCWHDATAPSSEIMSARHWLSFLRELKLRSDNSQHAVGVQVHPSDNNRVAKAASLPTAAAPQATCQKSEA